MNEPPALVVEDGADSSARAVRDLAVIAPGKVALAESRAFEAGLAFSFHGFGGDGGGGGHGHCPFLLTMLVGVCDC